MTRTKPQPDLLTADMDADEMFAKIEEICDHLRKRAYQCKRGEIDGQYLAASVIKHLNLISRAKI